jgi:hypothetical protein
VVRSFRGLRQPARAKSFLVETVLLHNPIPRVLLHVIDSPSLPHERDIIDGQQRCTILREFRENRFALTQDVDDEQLVGRRYRDLSDVLRDRFDSYQVPIDLYSGVSDRDIREVFRRLNYYTAPLNAAEQRHAQFSGELSTFVVTEADRLVTDTSLLRTFTVRQRRRKAPEQLLAEIVDAMLNGISTTTAKSLRSTYARYDRAFPSALDFERRIAKARGQLVDWVPTLRAVKLFRKHYHLFSFIMALIHAQGDLASLRADLGPRVDLRPERRIFVALQNLERAVSQRANSGTYSPFVVASQEKTNVRDHRLIRCRHFYRALTGAAIRH